MGRILRLPAPVDPHVHLRGLDWAHKGTFTTETAAALAGGYAAVLDMPNTPPPAITRAALAHKRAEIGAGAVSDWGLYFGAGPTADPAVYRAIEADVCGMKVYCNATTGDLLIEDPALREAHYAAWQASGIRRPMAVHAEGRTVADLLALAKKYGIWTHFCHISTAEELGYLRAAKAEGVPLSVGVTPHHLYLDDTDLARLGPYGLMKPGLKPPSDRLALWEALAEGLVDVIESDHAPHTHAEKTGGTPFYGVPGLETTLPLLGLAVHEGRLNEAQLVALVAENPRRIFGLRYGTDTYTEFEIDVRWTIGDFPFQTACGWSPFTGMTVYGRVRAVVVRGQRVYDGERVLAAPGSGRPVEIA